MTVPPDPRTQAALDRVRADLAALPDLTMPPEVADRIGRALAAADDRSGEARTGHDGDASTGDGRPGTGVIGADRTGSGPVEAGRTGTARPPGGGAPGSAHVRRRFDRSRPGGGSRRRVVRAAAGLAVPAGVAASVLALLLVPGRGGPAGPEPVSRADELRAAGAAAFGPDGAGPLADPVRRRGCLTAAGVPEPGATLLGGVRHDVDGRPGTLLVLGSGVVGRYRLVVVDAGCGSSGGRVLAQAVTGR